MNIREITEHNQQPEKSGLLIQHISQELIEEIGDLAYNTLAEFLETLAQKLPLYQTSITEASKHIWEARRISEPFMKENTKHKYLLEVQGKGSNQILAEISEKSEEEIQIFLKQLGAKIEKDAKADESRGRKKLSTALFSCANSLIG